MKLHDLRSEPEEGLCNHPMEVKLLFNWNKVPQNAKMLKVFNEKLNLCSPFKDKIIHKLNENKLIYPNVFKSDDNKLLIVENKSSKFKATFTILFESSQVKVETNLDSEVWKIFYLDFTKRDSGSIHVWRPAWPCRAPKVKDSNYCRWHPKRKRNKKLAVDEVDDRVTEEELKILKKKGIVTDKFQSSILLDELCVSEIEKQVLWSILLLKDLSKDFKDSPVNNLLLKFAGLEAVQVVRQLKIAAEENKPVNVNTQITSIVNLLNKVGLTKEAKKFSEDIESAEALYEEINQ